LFETEEAKNSINSLALPCLSGVVRACGSTVAKVFGSIFSKKGVLASSPLVRRGQMLLQARHEFDEVARPMTVVEL